MIPFITLKIELEGRSVKADVYAESFSDEVRLFGDLEAHQEAIEPALVRTFSQALIEMRSATRAGMGTAL